MTRTDAQLKLRISPEQRDILAAAASANFRSVNAEIISRLFSEDAPMAAASQTKPETITIRLSSEMKEKLDAACQAGPYRLSKTSIIERGIDLAVEEIRRMNPSAA